MGGVVERRGLRFFLAGMAALAPTGSWPRCSLRPTSAEPWPPTAEGMFLAGSLACGVIFDGFRPDPYDLVGAVICLIGVVVIMYAAAGT